MRTVEISVEFPGGTAGLGSCIVTIVVRVQSLAWELSHALGTTPPPKKEKFNEERNWPACPYHVQEGCFDAKRICKTSDFPAECAFCMKLTQHYFWQVYTW